MEKVSLLFHLHSHIKYKTNFNQKIVHESDNWYGLDGFSDVPNVPPTSSEIDESLIRSDYPSAFEAIEKIISENPYEVTIIAVGPLTNIARAMMINKDLPLLTKS